MQERKDKKDWVSYFDFVVVDARKHLFMYHNKELFPLYRRGKIRETGCSTLIMLLRCLKASNHVP